MTNERLPSGALLAVYPDRGAAERMARELVEDLGVASEAVRLDDPTDERRVLEAEVREETERGMSSPTVPVAYPKEAARATGAVLPVAVAVGAVIVALLSLAAPLGDLSIPVKMLIGAVVGATMGGAIAVVVVPAMSVANPQDPSPVEAGSTLYVADARSTVVDALVASEPVRLDRVADGAPSHTVVTEDDHSPGGPIADLRDSFAREAQADPEDKTR